MSIQKVSIFNILNIENIIMFHCLTSDTDPMRPTQTTPYTGETCKFTGRKPLICWGRKNPMSHLSRIKNPVCLVRIYLRPCGPTATSCTVLLRCFSHLGNHCFLLWLIKAGVHYIPAIPCQLLTMSCCYCFVSHILPIPYMLSLIN